MKTIIINKTSELFQLKEGNAGAYRLVKQLNADSRVDIKVDPNATYREYMVATGKKGETIILTSDDFSEYEVISIEVDPGTSSGYKSVPSQPRKVNLFAAAPESSSAKESTTPAPNSIAPGREPAPTAAPGVQSVATGVGVQSDPAVPPLVGEGQATPPVSSHAEGESAPIGAAGVQSVATGAGVQSDPAVPPPVGESQATPPGSSHAECEPALQKTKKKPSWYRKLKWLK